MPTHDEIAVTALFEHYEDALVRNDLEAMNACFVDSDDVLRFGIADMQFGFDELVAWRATASPVGPLRQITRRVVQELAPGVVAVDVTFHNGDDSVVGRQSQTWVVRDGTWRIIRAHVSVIAL